MSQTELPAWRSVLAVIATAREIDADGIIGFDLAVVTGHPDHAYATAAALRAADTLDRPVLGWTVPATVAKQLRNEQGAPFHGHSEWVPPSPPVGPQRPAGYLIEHGR